MIPGPTPEHPWEEVAADLFHWNDHEYLIIVDSVCKLEDTSGPYGSVYCVGYNEFIIVTHTVYPYGPGHQK